MASEPVIEIERLSKLYQLRRGHHAGRAKAGAAPLSKGRLASHEAGPRPGTFWALKDITFSCSQGEVIGLIGDNGAGKTTLLKVLSKIVRPTSGSFTCRGRVSSILEMGTGFHPELSGRRNVIMNGVLLGMGRREVEAKLEAIIDFSELGEFIEMPIKYYSSGMYVRLAFSVASHLNPETLLLDEALSVGDAVFRRKCSAKMGELVEGGSSVIVASHSLEYLVELCEKAVFLEAGRMRGVGPVAEICRLYRESREASFVPPACGGSRKARFLEAWVEDINGKKILEIKNTEPAELVVVLEKSCERPLNVNFNLVNSKEVAVLSTSLWDGDRTGMNLPPGRYRIELKIPPRLLVSGSYRLAGIIVEPAVEYHDYQDSLVMLRVEDMFSYFGIRGGRPRGNVILGSAWRITPLEAGEASAPCEEVAARRAE